MRGRASKEIKSPGKAQGLHGPDNVYHLLRLLLQRTSLFTFPLRRLPPARRTDALLKRSLRKLLMNKKATEGLFELSWAR